PPLVVDEKPDLSFDELISRLDINLEKRDLQKMIVFRRWMDLNNIRALYLEDAIDPRGTLSEKELDQALLLQEDLPEYVFDFLGQFESVQEKIRFFPGLLAAYFREEVSNQDGFLNRYLEFERSWRLVLLGIKSKELGRDLTEELQFEDLKDPLVMDLLAQKDSITYDPPPEFFSLKEKYLACGPDPNLQFKEMLKWRFKQIEELAIEPLFSVDWILSYMAQLLIVEQSNGLDPEKGKIILEAFVG
ncbi:MAG: DUF2764 family protein, partial [Rhabdochlamydiaceae bacterium]